MENNGYQKELIINKIMNIFLFSWIIKSFRSVVIIVSSFHFD